MAERLQKYIARMGFCSRRRAEELIAEGRVTVDGIPAEIGISVEPGRSEIKIDGKMIAVEEELVYIMLNKPRGYVTTTQDERGRKTVMELVQDVGTRVYPVGRLDMFSEGLLLLTDDGELTNLLTHPKHEIPKIYHVKVKGSSDEKKIKELGKPMIIDDYQIEPVKVEIASDRSDSCILRMTLYEGRNRQIRKMCDALGLEVARLKRTQIGSVKLGMLKQGDWRNLTEEEVHKLIVASSLDRKNLK